MAWYSVLPDHLTVYETWIIRTMLILAMVNMAPYVSLIVYDLLLYISRAIYHEIPLYGGRAQGHHRPRAPSLADRNRRLSIAEMIGAGGLRRSNTGEMGQGARGTEDSIDEEMEKY